MRKIFLRVLMNLSIGAAQAIANGNMGDLAPHPINAALALMGPIEKVMADIETCTYTVRVDR